MKKKKRLSGIERRWFVNNVGVIMLLVAACVLGVVFSMAAYYDTNLRSGLENKAKTTTDFFSNYISQNVRIDYRDKQNLLEELHPCKRLEKLIEILNHELNIMSIEQELNDATNEQVNRNQRDYYLREQMRVIREELGEEDEAQELDTDIERIKALKLKEEYEHRTGSR